MRSFSTGIFLLAFLGIPFSYLSGQETVLTKEYKEEVVDNLSMLMNDFYIYPEVAKETELHLKAQLNLGYFDQYENNDSFAQALTSVVQSVNKDKHMRVRAQRPYKAPENTIERKTEERMEQINRFRSFNHGFKELKILEGNVAYLDLRGFAGMEGAKEIADSYMKLMSNADAVIIDLSNNGGGSPKMVQYLCSYFFDEVLHLNSLHYRQDNRVDEFWTLEEVDGKKMADVPLFVITAEYTFSGAEEFSYNMQTQQRATLVGQTSGGGANPGGSRRINDKLSVFIPTGRAENPITKTSWEGVGVIPEVPCEVGESLDKAHALAKEAAEEFRKAKHDSYQALYQELVASINEYKKGDAETKVLGRINKFVDAGLFSEWDINALGYDYLLQHKNQDAALCIFKINTKLNPESPNVYDSYGEALMNAGDLKASISSYQKAVDLADANNDQDLEFYERNLQKVKDDLAKRK